MKLVIMSIGSVTLRIVKELLHNEKIELLGVIPDVSIDRKILEKYLQKLRDMNVPILSMDRKTIESADMIFVCEYRKLIVKEWVDNHWFVNCHAGILPKWRGFGANAWAIINGEEEIGYTFHRINAMMDDGEIYHIGKVPISKNQTYADVYEKMVDKMVFDAVNIIPQIYESKVKGYKQTGQYCYGHKFKPEYGELKDFNVESQYIYNLYRCMAKPLGTGIYFYYNGERINVNRVSLGNEENICNYIGIPGKVVNKDNADRIWVKTKDNVVILELDKRINILIGATIGES